MLAEEASLQRLHAGFATVRGLVCTKVPRRCEGIRVIARTAHVLFPDSISREFLGLRL